MRSCIRTLEGICFRLLAGLLLPNRQRRHRRSVREAAHHARRVGDCVVSRLWIHRPWKRRLPVTASGEVVLIFRIRERIIGKEQGTCSFWLRPWTSKTRMLMRLHVSITTDMLVCICNTVWQWFFGRVSTTATTTFLFIKKSMWNSWLLKMWGVTVYTVHPCQHILYFYDRDQACKAAYAVESICVCWNSKHSQSLFFCNWWYQKYKKDSKQSVSVITIIILDDA